MGIRDEVRADTIKRGPPCGVRVVLQDLDDKTRKDIEAAINDPDVPIAALVRAIQARGYLANGRPLRPGTVSKHRSRGCGCFVL